MGEAPDDDRTRASHPSVGDLLERVLNRLETLSGSPGEPAELSRAIEELRDGLALAAPSLEPAVQPDEAQAALVDAAGPDDLLARLARAGDASGRYRVIGEVGRGGMGVVVQVRDGWLRRSLARKSLHDGIARTTASGSSSPHVARFLEEAQIAAQLEHPGILPVHDIGVDASGQPFFTMPFVRGRSLRDVYVARAAGDEEWTLAHTVGALQRVAETMAYAHSKGVIHRDLKPANVMVGRFGEVYVMDWGLAKTLAEGADEPSGAESSRRVSTVRSSGDTARSPLSTVYGAALGTPAYMAPEQAFGSLDELGPRADVYALGAMLYHLLVGAPPYSDTTHERDPTVTVRRGPPAPIEELAPEAPPELVAIAERAMARTPVDRYPTMEAFEHDLRAWLEGRVVSAYEHGRRAELRKWIARNKTLAATAAAAVLVLLAGAVTTSIGFLEARERAADVLRLSALQDLDELRSRADRLWPAHPDRLDELRRWESEALALLEERPVFEARLAALRAAARPPTPEEEERARRAHPRFEELAVARADLAAHVDELARTTDPAERSRERAWIERQEQIVAELAAEVEAIDPWRFEADEDQWWHDRLVSLIRGLDELADPRTGLLDGFDPQSGAGIRRRIAQAEELARLQADPEIQERWRRAIESIADRADCPEYDGLRLVPQTGLVPLHRAPRSGLWEFWQVLSGEEPERFTSGRLDCSEEDGIVLVLVPGGTYALGCQKSDPDGPNYDPWSNTDEQPVFAVALEPFFLAKHETTQAQWMRLAGSNPSVHTPGDQQITIDQLATLLNPVESVTWTEARSRLGRVGLALPTEAQWECAARAGTTTPWWTGPSPVDLEGGENVCDATAVGLLPTADGSVDDGFLIHAPLDATEPNPWGFHHVLGNVCEWCEDRLGMYDSGLPLRPGTGERIVGPDQPHRVSRGGSFVHGPVDVRVGRRLPDAPSSAGGHRGVRAARGLERRAEDDA